MSTNTEVWRNRFVRDMSLVAGNDGRIRGPLGCEASVREKTGASDPDRFLPNWEVIREKELKNNTEVTDFQSEFSQNIFPIVQIAQLAAD